MTQKEKSIRYDEAIEIAKEINNEHKAQPFDVMLKVFPELKESEDERIRKEMIEILTKEAHDFPSSVIAEKSNSWIAWLEKQGEPKSYWKPSKDEMDALYGLAYITNKMDDKKDEAVTKLYQDLKREFFNGTSYENMFPSSPVNSDINIEKQGELIRDTDTVDSNEDGLIAETIRYKNEKQGEQKSADEAEPIEWSGKINSRNAKGILKEMLDKKLKSNDKVEPKFHEGEWITNGDYTWKIVEVKPLDYILQSQDGNIVDDTISHVDEQFHSFTIEDAKDGDVLFMDNGASNCIFIYKSFNNGIINKYASYNNFGFEGEHYLVLNDGYVIPAANEQRDLLFQKMKEASYVWDADKKELKKIEQKLVWSEEDEVKDNWEFVHEFVNKFGRIPKDEDELNVLVEYVLKRQKPTEWGEEDELYIEDTLALLSFGCSNHSIGEVQDWLKSLKGKVQFKNTITDEELAQAKKEAYIEALDKIEYHSGEPTFDDGWSAAIWYLKKRNVRPQNKWKPSDEQMDALENAISYGEEENIGILSLLYNDLKKLRKE